MGSLDSIWTSVPEEASEGGMRDAFRAHFGAEWGEVLHAADRSMAYNAANDAYFSVRDLHPVDNLTLEQILEQEGTDDSLNLIVG